VRPATAAVACLIAVAACSAEPGVTAPDPPVAVTVDGVSFTHPAAWQPVDAAAAADGTTPAGPVVGYLDAAGNLIGFAVEVQAVHPAVPAGEEQAYLDAVLSRHSAQLWGAGTVREDGWAEIDGRIARRSVVDHTARGEPLVSEILMAVEGDALVIVQCQAPAGVFDLLAPRCAAVLAGLRWDRPDSGAATGS